MADDEFEVFPGKTLSGLMKDIYDTTAKRRKELDGVIHSIDSKITNVAEAVTLGELLQKMFDTAIKNDDQLVKMAQIVQRILAVESKDGGGVTNIEDLISDEEREKLISVTNKIGEDFEDIKKEIHKKLEHPSELN